MIFPQTLIWNRPIIDFVWIKSWIALIQNPCFYPYFSITYSVSFYSRNGVFKIGVTRCLFILAKNSVHIQRYNLILTFNSNMLKFGFYDNWQNPILKLFGYLKPVPTDQICLKYSSRLKIKWLGWFKDLIQVFKFTSINSIFSINILF